MSEIVTITGATGIVGRRAVARLVAAGHDVRGVARSEAGRRLLEDLGARGVAADVFDEASLARAFAGSDVVVNLLTHIPPVAQLARPGAWKENDRLRREASSAIARAAGAAGASRLVQESVVFLYAAGGDAWLDEDAPMEPMGPAATALTAERNATEHFPGTTVVLRFGTFMGPDGEQTRMQVDQGRRGFSPWFTPRNGRIPTVWLDDAAAAVPAALAVPGGAYNVVDDDPPTRAESDAALAAVVGRERLHAPAAPVARRIPAMRAISRSVRASNRRLREASGWRPAVRGGTDGWRLVAAAQEADRAVAA